MTGGCCAGCCTIVVCGVGCCAARLALFWFDCMFMKSRSSSPTTATPSTTKTVTVAVDIPSRGGAYSRSVRVTSRRADGVSTTTLLRLVSSSYAINFSPQLNVKRRCTFHWLSNAGSDMMPALSELFDHLLVESWYVVRLAAGYQAIVDNCFLVNPPRAGIFKIGLQGRP